MTNSVATIPSGSVVPASVELLRGPTKRELHVAIEKLFTAFYDQQRPEPAKVAALYTEVISGFSAWSIKEGIRRIVEGEVPDVDRRFLPSTAVVAHTIRSLAENGPEGRERLWRRRLESWRSGKEWNPHNGQDPECESFEFICPKHLIQEFREATAHRRAFARM